MIDGLNSSAPPTVLNVDTISAQLDRWFAPANDESSSPLTSFIKQIRELRLRHSSLLILIDDLHSLTLHANASEMDVLDAIVTIQMELAAADAKSHASSQLSSTPLPSAPAAAFTIDLPSAVASVIPTSSSPLPSSIVLVSHGDVCVTPLVSLLRRHSSTFIRLNPLHTGYTKEISGVMTIQHHDTQAGDYWTPIQRVHYKLHESHVKISLPGHSSSTLQQ